MIVVRLGQVLLEDQASGTYADSGSRLRTDQREVVERVAHARHPVGHRIVTNLTECGITHAQIIETQHAETVAGQAVGEDPVQSDTVHPLFPERTTDQHPAPDLVIDRQMKYAEQWRIRRSEICRHLGRRHWHFTGSRSSGAASSAERKPKR